MVTSDAGIQLLKGFEGCVLQAYKDVVGIITIGYGHTEPGLQMGTVWTQQQAEDQLRKDLSKFEKNIAAVCKVALTQNQFDALVCFSYNVGTGSLNGSTLLKKLNAGNAAGAAEEFLRWNKVGGKEVAGLTKRRQAERALFLKGVESKELLSDGPSEADINQSLADVESKVLK
jgi:lysozyme